MGKQKGYRHVHHLSHKKKDKTSKQSRLSCHENFFKTVEEAVQAELTSTANSKKICRKVLKDLERHPLLFKAVFLGCEREVDNILEAGENVNAQISDGSTPLIIAVENGYPSIVQKLLKKGADPKLTRQDGRNALMISVAKNDIRSFTLIWNYWDKNNFCELNHSDSNGFTALIIATELGNSQFTTILLSLNGIEIDKQTKEGRTALMYAVSEGQTDAVRKLIASGSDIMLEDKNGATAVCLAIAQNKEDIKDILVDCLDRKAEEAYIKRRLEILSEPRSEDKLVLLTFCKEILFYVILEIRRRFENGIALLLKYKVFVSLLQCLESNQQNTELLRIGLHLAVCLMYDKAEYSRYIVDELAEHFMSSNGANFSLKIMNTYRLKNLTDLRGAAFLSIHAGSQCQTGKAWLKTNYFNVLPFVKEFRINFPTLNFWIDGQSVKAKIMFDRFMEVLYSVEKELTVAPDLKAKKVESVQENARDTQSNGTSAGDQQWCLVTSSKLTPSKISKKKLRNQMPISSIAKNSGRKKKKGNKLQTKMQQKIAMKKLGQQLNVKSTPDFRCCGFPALVPDVKLSGMGYADALKKNLSEDFDVLHEGVFFDSKKNNTQSWFQEISGNQDNTPVTKLEKDNNVNTCNESPATPGKLQGVCAKSGQNNWEKLMSFGMNMPDLKTIKDESSSQKDVAEFSYRDALKSTTGNCRKIQQQKSVLHDILVSIELKNSAVLNGIKENTKGDSLKNMEKIESKQFLNGLRDNQSEKSESSVSFASVLKKLLTKPDVKNTESFEETRLSDKDISLNLVAQMKSNEMKEKDTYRYGANMDEKSGSIEYTEFGKPENTESKCIVNRKSLEVENEESLEKFYEHKTEEEIDPTNDINQDIFKEGLQVENSMVRASSNESFEVDCNQTLIKDSHALILSNDPVESGRHIILNKRKYEESEYSDLSFSFYKEEFKERAKEFTTLFPKCCGDSKFVQKIESEYLDEKLGKIRCDSRGEEPRKITFDSLILDAFTEDNRKSYEQKQKSNSCLKKRVPEIKSIQARAKSNLSNFHKLILMYQRLVLHKAISHLRMSIFNEYSYPQTPMSHFVSSKTFTRGGNNLKQSADLSLTKRDPDNKYIAVLKDYASLTRVKGEFSQFLKAVILRSVERKDKHARFLFKHGIRAAKISERNENSRVGKSEGDENEKNNSRYIFSSNIYGYHPQFINCQYSSRWYKVLRRIETCVPLAKFLLGFTPIGKSFAYDDTMHELISSSGKIVFSSKEEHSLGDGKMKTNIGLMTNGNPVVVRRLQTSEPNAIGFLMKKRRLNHRNIAAFYCVCSSDVERGTFAVTELVEYSLPEYMKLVNYDAKFLVQELVEGVRYLHGKRIVHGFLKPTNIMVTLEHRLKVTGFYQLDVELLQYGILRKGDTHSAIGRPTLSKFCWRPYECIAASSESEARRYLTAASDIQMTGMLAYYILSDGNHPFGRSDQQCQENIRDGFPELGPKPSDVESRDLIRNMILKIPLSRPKISAVAKHPFLWNIVRRFQFLVAVSRKIDFFTQKPTKFAENLKDSCIEGRNWTSYVHCKILKYISKEKNKIYSDNYIDMLNFIAAVNDHFEVMPAEIKVAVHEPSVFTFTAFPTIFMSVYCVVRDNPCVQQQMALQDYF